MRLIPEYEEKCLRRQCWCQFPNNPNNQCFVKGKCLEQTAEYYDELAFSLPMHVEKCFCWYLNPTGEACEPFSFGNAGRPCDDPQRCMQSRFWEQELLALRLRNKAMCLRQQAEEQNCLECHTEGDIDIHQNNPKDALASFQKMIDDELTILHRHYEERVQFLEAQREHVAIKCDVIKK